MLDHLNTYIDARIAEANTTISGTDNDLLKASMSLVFAEMPDNQKDKRYILKINSLNEVRAEAKHWDIDLVVELSFLIPNSDVTKYQAVIDNYINALIKCIYDRSTYVNDSTPITFSFECKTVGATDLNNFNEGELESEYRPKVTLTGVVFDNISLSLAVPSAPTLTSPANGSTAGLIYQPFNWTGTADTWDLGVSLNGTTVFSQNGITTTSFTIPLDSGLTDGETYNWSVRGRNAAGIGTWASEFSFTVNDVDYDPDFSTWLEGITAPTAARKTLMNDLIVNLRADGIWAQLDSFIMLAAETTEHALKNWIPNNPLVVAVASPTFTADRGYATNGSSQYLKTGTAPAYQLNYTQNNACYGLYVNTNVNEAGQSVDMGCSSPFCLLYTRFGGQTYVSINDAGSTPNVASSSSIGLFAIDRQASGSYKVYKNGSNTLSPSFASTGVAPYDFYIGARNFAGTADRFAAKRYAFAFVGQGLSAAEHATLYSRINTYLTAIGGN